MTGVMFVGVLGVNATTLIAGVSAIKKGIYPYQYGITGSADFSDLNLITLDDMVFGGWDYRSATMTECLEEYRTLPVSVIDRISNVNSTPVYKGVWTAKDIPVEKKFDYLYFPSSIQDGIAYIKSTIVDFRVRNQLETVIVVYLGSPSKAVDEQMLVATYEQIIHSAVESVPSSLLYAMAALESGAHFVDFTPSETLDFSFINELAIQNNVQLSGRDGSTGQTMLKLVVADMFRIRALHLDAWFSTNILGNHDGYVLSIPEYCKAKIEDKTLGIQQLLGYDDYEHLVTINYFGKRNDSKESWDSVDFSGWLNTPMTLKLNWHGEDAMLAAPIILDIIRLIDYNERNHLCGFQKQLGVFFKHPYGSEGFSLSEMYHNLISFYKDCEIEK